MSAGKKNYNPDGSKVLPKPRILVGIPLMEMMFSRFFAEWTTLCFPVEWQVITCTGAYVQDAHQRIVEKAMSAPDSWDCLLLMEQDHTYPPDFRERVEKWAMDPKLHIVGGQYFLRRLPTVPVGFQVNTETKQVRQFTEQETVEMIAHPGLYSVGVVGMGGTLIRKEVFQAWPPETPYFTVPTNWGDDVGRIASDDAFFCLSAKELGFDVYIDSSCQVKHLTLVEIGHEQYIAQLAAEIQRRKQEAEAVGAIAKPKIEVVRRNLPSKLELVR